MTLLPKLQNSSVTASQPSAEMAALTWEDGIGSDAFYAALERENESRGPSVQKNSATISSLVNPRLAVDQDALNEMWDNMVLMDEHTWLSWNSVSDPSSREATEQLRLKDSRAVAAAELRDQPTSRSSMASVADSIAAGVGSIIVFNPLNWVRDGIVSIDLDKGYEIVDRATEQPAFVSLLCRRGMIFSG